MTAFPGAYCVISDGMSENESPCTHQRVIDMIGCVRARQQQHKPPKDERKNITHECDAPAWAANRFL